MNRKIVTVIAACTFIIAVAGARQSTGDLEKAVQQKPNDVKTLVALGRVYSEQGAAGDEEATMKGLACFDKILEMDSKNAVAIVYRGSLLTIRGRDAADPLDKMKYVEKGMDEMDRAVEIAPDDITVRLVRGINSLKLPSMFNRLPIAIKDLSFLLADSRFSHLDARLQSTIFYWSGIAFKQDGQKEKAKALLEKAVSAAMNSDIASMAQEELKAF